MKVKLWQVLIIILLVIALISYAGVYVYQSIVSQDKEVSKEVTSDFYDNGWDKQIVADIKNEVPIPDGFEYVSGQKETGLIIKNSKTQEEYMWIPKVESENMDKYIEEVDAYFSNKPEVSISPERLLQIETYGGFFVGLKGESEKAYNIKEMTYEDYEEKSQEIQEKYDENSSVNSNLLSREELQMILEFQYSRKDVASKTFDYAKVKIASNTPVNISSLIAAINGITLTVKQTEKMLYQESVPEKWKNTIAYVTKEGVPIPKGFEISTAHGTYTIKSGIYIVDTSSKYETGEAKGSHRLTYVWIPVDTKNNTISELSATKEALKKYYNGKYTDLIDNSKEELPEDLQESVKEYGGFYMSEAELGYDNWGYVYNRPRGMKKVLDNLMSDYGDYYRYIPEEIKNANTTVTYANVDTNMTINKAKKICENLYNMQNKENKAVVSHLTYGAEWDAAIMWMIRSGLSSDIAVVDSTPIGKYAGSVTNIKSVNCLWGLAGNLAEMTQETYDGKVVVRGGSYKDLGKEYPMASRQATEDLNTSSIGFRNCLYIQLPDKMPEEEEISETIKEYYNGIPIPKGFKKLEKYTNGTPSDGLTIYDESNDITYEWIPINEANTGIKKIEDAKSVFKQYYAKAGEYYTRDIINENVKTIDNCTEDLPKELKESIAKYGGFYMCNMEMKDINQHSNPETVAQMIEEAKGFYKNDKTKSSSVQPHLTYGAEWDSAMVWLIRNAKINGQYIDVENFYTFLVDSKTIGQFESNNSSKFIKNMIGLAGRYGDVTQEKNGNKIVVRGGTWLDDGEKTPAGSRQYYDEADLKDGRKCLSYRICLYIK